MNNAVIYARFSSTGQNEQTIDGQVRVCREYAESKGLNIVKTYNDKARTGTNDNRPEFQKMLVEAETGAFQHIIVYKFDRFARNRLDSILHKAQLKKNFGIKVVSATEPVSEDEGGEIYEMFLEWNDEKFSQRLSKRVKDGLLTAIENGTYTGQRLICGYKLVPTDKAGRRSKFIHTLAIDEEQAEIVRLIFTEYAKGTNKKQIAEMLNKAGKTFRGNRFTHKTFDNWLSNERYTGEFTMLGVRVSKMFPQIIDKELFNAVQIRLAQNKILAGANSAVEPYLLTGKLFCGCCESGMIAGGGTSSHNGKKHYYYECKKKKKRACEKKVEKKDFLEKYVVDRVIKFLSDPKNVAMLAQDVIDYHEQRTSDEGLRAVENKINHANEETEKLTNSFILAKNDMLRLKIERKMDELEIYLKDLISYKAKLEIERGARITKEKIASFILALIKGDPNDKEYQKRIIDNLVFMVYVTDEDIITYLNIKGGKDIERVSLAETQEFLKEKERQFSVQTLSSMVRLEGLEPPCR